jgi:hypothetical protein
MNSLERIFEILARDCNYWLPSYDNIVRPINKEDQFISDTEDGFEYYCEWLTDYLTNNIIPIASYQLPIIKRLKKRKEISNVYMIASVGFSSECLFVNGFEKYPKNFLEDPNPNRIKNKELKKFKDYFEIPKFKGLDANENLQVSLVFKYIAIQQNKIREEIEGPIWCDIGWRGILKEGLQTVENRKEKIDFVKDFINEIAYLQSK